MWRDRKGVSACGLLTRIPANQARSSNPRVEISTFHTFFGRIGSWRAVRVSFRGMKSLLLTLIALLPLSTIAADELATVTVEVSNIPTAQGNLLIGIYDSAGNFVKAPLPQSPKIPLKSTEPVRARIEGVKPGTYAIVIVHDLNGNGKLDKNFIGMPKEPLAFSRNPKIPRGLPPFDACSFVVEGEDLSLSIPLKLK